MSKKEKLLYTFNKMGKEGISKIDLFVLLGSMILGAFALDFNLKYVSAVSGFLFYVEFMFCICTILSLIITELIIRKRNKKSNIEKLIDEESKK